jgi:hypothetical protein
MAIAMRRCRWNSESCDLAKQMAEFGLGKKGKAAKFSLICLPFQFVVCFIDKRTRILI